MDKYEIRELNLYYGTFQALKNVYLSIPEREITAFIGPPAAEVHASQNAEPDERPDRRPAVCWERSSWTARISTAIST